MRHEKSPIQQAIEAELARKREQDAGYEDVTYVSHHDYCLCYKFAYILSSFQCPYQPFPLPLPQQFFQSLSPQKSRVRFRKRIGRGGRVFIDRIGHRIQPLEGGKGGKQHSPSAFQQNAYERYRFDHDSSDDEETMEIDDMSQT